MLLLDAGTGVQRLVEDPGLLDGVGRLDIVLTHFHLDHVAGLSYLPALPLQARIWGPGEALYGAPTEVILDRLLTRPLFAASVAELAADVREISAAPFEVGPFEIATRVQRLHTDPTLGLRIGDELAYCTDTAADRGTVEFADGCRMLFHEAWHAEADTDDQTHTAAGEAGRIARSAGVEHLTLIHVSPLGISDEELVVPARVELPAAQVGEDLVAITLV
ncbi:MAG: MBL fold metallo-hydrolase [Actinomycetota bacterium]|nr:MBL fold metallo-hydrolase [Actinomycetota bacterium]